MSIYNNSISIKSVITTRLLHLDWIHIHFIGIVDRKNPDNPEHGISNDKYYLDSLDQSESNKQTNIHTYDHKYLLLD